MLTIATIVRWKNLSMMGIIQTMIAYYLAPLFFESPSLNDWQLIGIIVATLFIAIGGYIINDIYDLDIDKINKPQQVWIPSYSSLTTAKKAYYFTTGIGLLFGFFVSFSTTNPVAIFWFITPAVLLYLYASHFKKVLFLGNFIVAILIVFSIVVIAYFVSGKEIKPMLFIFSFWDVIWTLSIFAFGINLMREIVKDAEDYIGDKANTINSIPILYGYKKTKSILQISSFIMMGIIVLLSIYLFKTQILISLYLIFAVLLGFGLYSSQLNKAKNSTDYGKLSKLLKILMSIGLFSVFLIQI